MQGPYHKDVVVVDVYTPDVDLVYEGLITPSVGLQNEYIEFGIDSASAVRYRIWGSRFDRRIMPHGAQMPAVGTAAAAMEIGRAHV